MPDDTLLDPIISYAAAPAPAVGDAMPIDRDTHYLLRRSEAEAVQAITATDSRAAAIHQELCLLYVGRALADLAFGSTGRRRDPST